MKVVEPYVFHHMDGVIEGLEVQHNLKMYDDVAYLYERKRDDNPIVYEVYSYTQGEEGPGHLNWGLTILKPILSFEECNMTKGHFHVNKDCAEIYFGIAGDGLLLFMDEAGSTWAQKVCKCSLHYIDGHWAQRLVNVGDSDLKVGACWSTDAGHDYQSIKESEFGYRIFKRRNGLEFIKR